MFFTTSRKLALDPMASGFSVIVSGHSHKPEVKRLNEVLFVNPGSAGSRVSPCQ
jgi:uncharacterized protein